MTFLFRKALPVEMGGRIHVHADDEDGFDVIFETGFASCTFGLVDVEVKEFIRLLKAALREQRSNKGAMAGAK
ncbi:MAG: hypothetical protein KGL35_16555 [Bradyrhizobium sp.]|nr:hypothetical protein [Bradyrhizobium sp.]